MTDRVEAVEWLARRLLSRHVDRDVPADEWETLPEYIREVWRPQAAAALDRRALGVAGAARDGRPRLDR